MSSSTFLTMIVGKAETGKTHLAKQLLSTAPKPVVIVDRTGQYDWPVAESWSDLKTWNVSVYRPPSSDADNELFQRMVEATNSPGEELPSPMTLVLDELQFHLQSPGKAKSGLDDLLTVHRHAGVNIIGCGQRPAQLPTTFEANARFVFCKRLQRDDDIREMVGYGFDRGKIEALTGYEALLRNMDTDEHWELSAQDQAEIEL